MLEDIDDVDAGWAIFNAAATANARGHAELSNEGFLFVVVAVLDSVCPIGSEIVPTSDNCVVTEKACIPQPDPSSHAVFMNFVDDVET